jgi:hypothetical protein
VRTLESVYALELAKRQTAALRRAVDTYRTASLFVSARGGRWSLMHMNDVALRMAGARALSALPSCNPEAFKRAWSTCKCVPATKAMLLQNNQLCPAYITCWVLVSPFYAMPLNDGLSTV